jgi:protoheme IX farnesyltransferase
MGILRDYFALTKPGIIALLLVTGYCAMVVAHGGLPGVGVSLLTAAGLFLSCGGANAINMWYDRDIDAVMARTRGRPLPAGRVRPEAALAMGFVMEAASFVLLWRTVNPLAAWLALAGFVYYVFIYTMWLKRRTPQNIVIGGGAGAFPPLVGWAAATGRIGLAAILMFLIILFWTPPHFWALALFKQDDYRRAGVPMMPVVRGELATKWQMLGYTVVLLVASLLLYWTKVVGVYYFAAAWILGLVFVGYALFQFREQAPEVKWAKRTFRFSLIYLTALFAVMVLNVRR